VINSITKYSLIILPQINL